MLDQIFRTGSPPVVGHRLPPRLSALVLQIVGRDGPAIVQCRQRRRRRFTRRPAGCRPPPKRPRRARGATGPAAHGDACDPYPHRRRCFRVAAIHSAYVCRIEGFEVNRAGPHRRLRQSARWTPAPDLMLLDLYLPDEHAQLVGAARLPTAGGRGRDQAAKDSDSVRAADGQGGAGCTTFFKPSPSGSAGDSCFRLPRCAPARRACARLTSARGRVSGALRAPGSAVGRQGRSVHTLEAGSSC